MARFVRIANLKRVYFVLARCVSRRKWPEGEVDVPRRIRVRQIPRRSASVRGNSRAVQIAQRAARRNRSALRALADR